jgi:hypothetical protein
VSGSGLNRLLKNSLFNSNPLSTDKNAHGREPTLHTLRDTGAGLRRSRDVYVDQSMSRGARSFLHDNNTQAVYERKGKDNRKHDEGFDIGDVISQAQELD